MGGRRWTEEERDLVRSLRLPDDEGLMDLAELIERTPKAITSEIYREIQRKDQCKANHPSRFRRF